MPQHQAAFGGMPGFPAGTGPQAFGGMPDFGRSGLGGVQGFGGMQGFQSPQVGSHLFQIALFSGCGRCSMLYNKRCHVCRPMLHLHQPPQLHL